MKKLNGSAFVATIVIVFLTLFLALAPACAKPTPTPSPTPTQKPTASPSSKPTASPTATPIASPTSTTASQAASFYKGKTLTLVVANPPGGGKDLCARTLAPFLASKTGSTVIVKNMDGAAGMAGTNYTYSLKNPDGLTVCVVGNDVIKGNYLMGAEGVNYDLPKFSFIGIFQSCGYVLYVAPDSQYKTIQDLQSAKKQLRLGGGSATGGWTLGSAIATDFLPLNARVCAGYSVDDNGF